MGIIIIICKWYDCIFENPNKIGKMMWLHIWKIQGNLTKTVREYNKVVSYKVSIQQWIHKPLFLNQSKWPKDGLWASQVQRPGVRVEVNPIQTEGEIFPKENLNAVWKEEEWMLGKQ